MSFIFFSGMPSLHKHTKIVCTLGPASSSPTVLKNMIEAGMNIARINFSHGTYEKNQALVTTVRSAAQKAKVPVAILQDLQGPKVRIGEVREEGIVLTEGKTVTLQAGVSQSTDDTIPVPYARLAKSVKPGDHILLDDGTKELTVDRVDGTTITATVLLGGTLLSRKGITVPNVSLVADAITKKDEEDLAFGLTQNIDFVAMSFIRRPQDVRQLKDLIARYLPKGTPPPAIIAKIEKQEALENFDAILDEVDGVMIARGDLGLETPINRVPLHQKEIITKCRAAHKPVITATEMLGSMQFNPRPTRAEVSDVANAVFDRTDAVMLSGESAMGRFPVRAVEMMASIIRTTEEALLTNEAAVPQHRSTAPDIIAQSAVQLARQLTAKAIIVITRDGEPAHIVSSLRSHIPVFAVTSNERLYHQLLLSWSIIPLLMDITTVDEALKKTLKLLAKQFELTSGSFVILSDIQADSNAIQIKHV